MVENRFKTPSRSTIFQNMKNYYRTGHAEGNTQITDFSEGSEIGTLAHSVAVELEALYLHDALLCDQRFVKTAQGSFLDLLAGEHHIQRFNGSFAQGLVQFTVYGENTVAQQDIVIPAGTEILHRRNGLKYVLLNNCIIEKGVSQSNNVVVVAEYPGSKYNCKTHMLTSFSSVGTWSNQIYVTNTCPCVGGTDPETDAELRERILAVKRDHVFGTIGWYKTQLEQIAGVHDVAFVNPNEEGIQHYRTINGKTKQCKECSRIAYVNRDEYYKKSDDANDNYLYGNVLQHVTAYLENQNNTVFDHKFHVEEAKAVPFYLEIYAYDNEKPTEAELMECLTAYFDGGIIKQGNNTYTYRGLDIHSKVRKGDIIDALEHLDKIDQVEGVYMLKYNTNIEKEVKSDLTADWIEVPGTSLYNYTDKDGYTFEAKNVFIGQPHYDFWGRKSLTEVRVPVDSYPTIESLEVKYNHRDTTDKTWYSKWADEWYDPDYIQLIYHSLGRAVEDRTYLTDDGSAITITDDEDKIYRGPNNEMPIW